MVGEWGEIQAASILSRLDSRIESLIETLRGDSPEPQGPAYVPPTFLPQGSTPAPMAVAASPSGEEAPATYPAPDETPLELKAPPAPSTTPNSTPPSSSQRYSNAKTTSPT